MIYVGASFPFAPADGSGANFQNFVFLSELTTMDEIQELLFMNTL